MPIFSCRGELSSYFGKCLSSPEVFSHVLYTCCASATFGRDAEIVLTTNLEFASTKPLHVAIQKLYTLITVTGRGNCAVGNVSGDLVSQTSFWLSAR